MKDFYTLPRSLKLYWRQYDANWESLACIALMLSHSLAYLFLQQVFIERLLSIGVILGTVHWVVNKRQNALPS